MYLSSRRLLLLLASHRMALTKKRRNPSRIARKINLFSNFAGSVPTLVPKYCSMFRVFRHTICWSRWLINICVTFSRKKITLYCHFPCGMLFLPLTQKQVQIWERCFSFIVGLRSPNFAQRWTLVHWNRINRHFRILGEEISGNGISTIWKWKFIMLQNGMVSYT